MNCIIQEYYLTLEVPVPQQSVINNYSISFGSQPILVLELNKLKLHSENRKSGFDQVAAVTS